MKWVFNQLDPAYRLQADASVERAYKELEEVRILLSTAVLRDHEAHIAYLKAVAQRKQVMAKCANEHSRSASTKSGSSMRRNGCRQLCEMPLLSPSCQLLPMRSIRRRLPFAVGWPREALERLEYQINYLTEWQRATLWYSQERPGMPREAQE